MTFDEDAFVEFSSCMVVGFVVVCPWVVRQRNCL